jgi:hypothetical protein
MSGSPWGSQFGPQFGIGIRPGPSTLPVPGGIPYIPPPAAPNLSTAYSIVPTSEAPAQQITITLAGQACLIRLYTKSTNVPTIDPGEIPTDPEPRYENINPCFVDVYTGSGANLIVGGVYVRQGTLIVRDVYLGFVGDLVVVDTTGAAEDPRGVPARLPPTYLRNQTQLAEYPLADGDMAPPAVAGRIPGMGTRWILTYWPVGSYVPGYSLPRSVAA